MVTTVFMELHWKMAVILHYVETLILKLMAERVSSPVLSGIMAAAILLLLGL